jgi:hypothetical protein
MGSYIAQQLEPAMERRRRFSSTAQSRVFYSFCVACRASKLSLGFESQGHCKVDLARVRLHLISERMHSFWRELRLRLSLGTAKLRFRLARGAGPKSMV